MRLPPSDWMKPSDLHEALNRRRVIAAWGRWVECYVWSHYATFTFATPVSMANANWQFARLVRRLEQRAQSPICWFKAVERSGSGLPHIHALFLVALSSVEIAKAWGRGRRLVVPFEPGRGGGYYVSKAITSDDAEVDFSARLPPARYGELGQHRKGHLGTM